MKICPHCQSRYEDAVKFCPHDGTVLPDQTDEYVGRCLMEQFDIRSRCGEGAMGTVYRAHQINMDRSVAVKILRHDLVRDRTVVKRFYREAKAAARLSHPNIITVHLVAETDEGLPYIVMEFLEGTDLDTLCKQAAPVSIPRAVHLTQQIAGALAEAHQNDVIHRDLKPANIIVLERQRTTEVVKVLDFGIAKILEAGASDESRITKSGAIFGTPYYLSPEQASGAELDARADLYSLGVILYRLVTGHLPFEGGSGLDILVRHVKDPPPPPRLKNPEIPAALESVILRSLEKKREARFQSADEMRAALLSALDDAGIPLSGGAADASSPWALPTAPREDPKDQKKTVAGFAAGGGNADPGLLKPDAPDRDPLVQAAQRVLSPAERRGISKPEPPREGRPTVAGTPAAPAPEAGAGGAPPEEGFGFGPTLRPAEGPTPGAAGSDVGAAEPRRQDAASATPSGGAGGLPGWSAPAEHDSTDDLPGSGRQHVAAAAPAPVPKPKYDPETGQGVALRPQAPAPPPPASPPAVRSTPPAVGPGAHRADSSPSMVSGQHAAPGSSAMIALQRARDRGRWITLGATALALVALGVGIYFVIRDQQGRSAGSEPTPARRRGSPGPDARAMPSPRPDARPPRPPRFAAGRELLKGVHQGLGVRVSSEKKLVARRSRVLVVDLWQDGEGRPCGEARVVLELRRGRRRRPTQVKARETKVRGRYALSVVFRRPGQVEGKLHIDAPDTPALVVPLSLRVASPSGGVRHHPRTVHPMRRRPPPRRRPPWVRPRDRPRPMLGLPRPPPDEGMDPSETLPRLPRDPPTPPPDPD